MQYWTSAMSEGMVGLRPGGISGHIQGENILMMMENRQEKKEKIEVLEQQ